MATLQNTTIPDAGTIGSVSDPDAISISSAGVVATSAELDVSSGTFTTSAAQKTAIAAAAFATGTKMIFNQTSAPTGWTKDTSSNDNSALRVVTGSVSTGGSVDFTTAFASQSIASHNVSVSGHTLSGSEMPSHTHSYNGRGTCPIAPHLGNAFVSGCTSGTTGSCGGGGSHSHSTGGSQSHSDIDLAVKYVDIIIATKD